ncbi:hypothetical protein SAMN06265373_108146 [Shimia sagamensis]|uniref:Tail assembly chaperone n=2 Tax=Shimia sagamensis TaxID=1566352 RepID=A0ABY1PDQ8_9RHOB|nr:hypothetical protein SAMN06265373_108146 [Shimia sagamensis]
MWEREKLDLALPDISRVSFILEWLGSECLGWFTQDGMGGLRPISWGEMDAFARLTQTDFEPWEAEQLRKCSAGYVAGYNLGRQPMVVSPAYEDRPDDDPGVAVERRRVSEQMKSALSGLAKK